MSYLKFGNTSLPTDECNLAHIDVRLLPSHRGMRKEQLVTWYLIGQIYDTGASLVSTINARRTLFGTDYADANFYVSENGSDVLTHSLTNANSISGVRVTRASFPSGAPEELCTQRTYGVTLQATYPSATSELLYWQEQLEFIGDCGPDFEIVRTFFGPIAVTTALATEQCLVQSGFAIGYTGYPLLPGPLYPGNERHTQRAVRVISGNQRGQVATDYGIGWRYVHYSSSPLDTYPNTR